MNPGSIVRCRNRDWVLLPSERADVHLLRPLAGATELNTTRQYDSSCNVPCNVPPWQYPSAVVSCIAEEKL